MQPGAMERLISQTVARNVTRQHVEKKNTVDD